MWRQLTHVPPWASLYPSICPQPLPLYQTPFQIDDGSSRLKAIATQAKSLHVAEGPQTSDSWWENRSLNMALLHITPHKMLQLVSHSSKSIARTSSWHLFQSHTLPQVPHRPLPRTGLEFSSCSQHYIPKISSAQRKHLIALPRDGSRVVCFQFLIFFQILYHNLRWSYYFCDHLMHVCIPY